ncbi:MAG: hypothetical protein LQ342_003358 [Letrouitia transgressa]|nr:MAG: hypothetical protein LQ342_003358 [Letrouitia transgressa]
MLFTSNSVGRYVPIVLLYFLVHITLVVFWNRFNLPDFHGVPSSAERTRALQVANATQHELETWLQRPQDVFDFGAMGDNIARFSTLAEIATKHESIDQKPFLSLLRQQFPWWMPSRLTYLPWKKSSVAPSETTGLVLCVGSNNLIYAIHVIRGLRNVLNSTLPIQIAYAGDSDLSFSDRAKLTQLGPDIETLDLLNMFDDSTAGIKNGTWAMKPFAVLASRFQRVILVDADAIFLQSPDKIFEADPGLSSTGFLFWKDRAIVRGLDPGRHAWVKQVMKGRLISPVLHQSLFWAEQVYHQMDSAVVCIDKGRPRVFMTMMFTAWMNSWKVRSEVTYKHVHGDKETFWLAAELSHTPYHFNSEHAGAIGYMKNGTTNEVCSNQALHLNWKGEPFWLNGGLRHFKSGEHREFGTFTHWIVGDGKNFTSQLAVTFQDYIFCARGTQPHALSGTKYEESIQRTLSEAQMADEEFYGGSGLFGGLLG